jgi:NhaA family Na+:H+ antiporter
MEQMFSALPFGVVLGLVLGKPIGITLAALALRATGKVRWPEGMDARAMIGMGMLCGIGFTMSLFIGSLAYASPYYEESVLGILAASVIASLLGLGWLRMVLPARPAGRD